MLDRGSLAADSTLVCAFFDHEEIGSVSRIGADGSFLPDTLERIAVARGVGRCDLHRAMAQSFLISADMDHAYQPNFPRPMAPSIRSASIRVGHQDQCQPALQYGEPCRCRFIDCCEQAGVPFQKYSHRSDIPCGSTIGPMTAAKLGMRSIDVGNPLWAMHSVRESAGVLDHDYLIRALKKFFSGG